MMSIWHKRGELPKGFIDENKLFVYIFEDGVDVTEYCERYHKYSNYKKWCVFNELIAFEKKNEGLQEKLDIAVKALEKYADKNNWSESTINLGVKGFDINTQNICVPNSYFGEEGQEEAQEALAKIKEIK